MRINITCTFIVISMLIVALFVCSIVWIWKKWREKRRRTERKAKIVYSQLHQYTGIHPRAHLLVTARLPHWQTNQAEPHIELFRSHCLALPLLFHLYHIMEKRLTIMRRYMVYKLLNMCIERCWRVRVSLPMYEHLVLNLVPGTQNGKKANKY